MATLRSIDRRAGFHYLLACICWVAASLAACGGGSGKSSSPVAPTPPAPKEQWAIDGRVLEYGTGAALGGVRVTAEGGGGGAVSTDAQGAFHLSSTSSPQVFHLTAEAGGHVARETYVRPEAGSRTLDLDVIPTAAPFSLDFYRQLARNGYEETEYEPLWRLTTAPRFYLRTVDQNGRAIEPEVLRVVRAAIPRAVSAWSGGAFLVGTLETGTAKRERTAGWIVVEFKRQRDTRTCGSAYVGASDGYIELVDDICSCGSIKIPGSVVVHEIGHALGFFHVKDRSAVMYPFDPGDCREGELSARERYHAKLAYHRMRGNSDPDTDPSSMSPLLVDEGSGPLIVN